MYARGRVYGKTLYIRCHPSPMVRVLIIEKAYVMGVTHEKKHYRDSFSRVSARR